MLCHEFVESLVGQNEQLLHTKSENESLRKEMTQLQAEVADLQVRNTNLEKENQAVKENCENILDWCREFKETQAEEQRTVEDLYRKALHTIERLKENADDEHGLNETGQSLHDEMEEAQALAVDEEMHSFMVLEGEEKDAEQRSTNSVWRSFCRWFTSSLGISVKSASRLIKNNPNGLYDRRRCI